MEYLRESDKNHKGYNHFIDIKDQLNKQDIKEYMGRLTLQEKAYLTQFRTLLRQRKYLSNDEKRLKTNKERLEYITNIRIAEPERMAEQNRKNVANYKIRNKAKEEELRQRLREMEAKATLTDVIRARKARQELQALKEVKEDNKIVGEILEKIPKNIKQVKNKKAVRLHRAKKQTGQPTYTYNTRSKKQNQ